MIRSECPECDATVPVLARACSHCGAPNPVRRGAIVAITGISALLIASMAAIYMAMRPPSPVNEPGPAALAGEQQAQPAAAQPQPTGEPAPAPQPQAAAGAQAQVNQVGQGLSVMPAASISDPNFSWLSSAMTACDTLASAEPRKLHFLVIPLQANEKDLPDWRLLALGSIGNGLTVRTDDALGGLRRGTLKIGGNQYVFGVQDAATRLVYKWGTSAGANRFSTPDVEALRFFRLQLQPLQKADQPNWGDVYTRQNGSCHWIAAIMRD